MDLNALINALGYLRSKGNWVTAETADPRLSHYYRLAKRAGDDIGLGAEVVGSYVYQTSKDNIMSPPRPAIFVAKAEDEDQAKKIHKRLWNLGNCPFLIIVLPGVVRVYSGFKFSPQNPKQSITEVSTSLLEELPSALVPFHADSTDSGRIWLEQVKYLNSDTKVDSRLLTNLKELSEDLQFKYGLARNVAHSLIGKYIYVRYLKDRGILDDAWLASKNIDGKQVFEQTATATSFELLTEALQIQFNGDIFPFPEDDIGLWRTNNAVPYLVGIFNGNSTYGQLALDFQVYDFSYIPVELLSSIYEQFLKAEGKGTGDGVVYTPEALADYVFAEMEAVYPLKLTHLVLDPCCGSGVFLVLAYRRLIEKYWKEKGEKPLAEEMKHLLRTNIFGIEKDTEACHITAFSLYLTLLSHLDPPELHANENFQFPNLVGENIFHSDFFDNSCPIFCDQKRFDWVVGNPPWNGADEKNEDHVFALAWMKEAIAQGRKVGERRLDEAFAWRVGDLLKESGVSGLLIKATSLVNSTSAGFRKSFFKSNYVRRITNLTNLRRILFMGPQGKRAEAPAACIVYSKASPGKIKKPILHFGPFVANQIPIRTKGGSRSAWTITLYESEIQEIDYSEAECDFPCLWKLALWGGYQDQRVLSRLNRHFPMKFADIVLKYGWTMCKGTQIKSVKSRSTNEFVFEPKLVGKRILESKKLTTRFALNEDAIPLLEPKQQFVNKRGGSLGLKLIPFPHVVITAEIALYSDRDFVIPSPKVGVGGVHGHAKYLKAVALYINSSVARYSLFFNSPLWGMYIGTINPENMGAIPFVDLLPQQVQKLAETYDELVELEQKSVAEHAPLIGDTLDLQNIVDEVVEAVLQIPADIAVIAREFMRVKYQLTEGKTGNSASKPPDSRQLREYAEQLRLQVDDFAQRHHKITIHSSQDAVIATIEVTSEPVTLDVVVTQVWNSVASGIMQSALEQHSQWVYVQRSVRIYDGHSVHIIKSARLLDWTRTQAIQDAGELISDVLDRNSPRHD